MRTNLTQNEAIDIINSLRFHATHIETPKDANEFLDYSGRLRKLADALEWELNSIKGERQ